MRPMSRSALKVLLAACSCLAHAAQPGPEAGIHAEPRVDAFFAAFDQPRTPGCALGVIRNGEFAYRRGYGVANLEFDAPITPQSVFRIGSTSKQFTATAIALLAEDGALSLDDPISRYFSGFPQWAQSVTVRHLVHHTSGIPDYLELAFLAGKSDDTDYYTDEWVIELLARQQRTLFPPGQRHAYSNSGYVLLAHIVRQASGQSLSDFAEARIFGPLGMQDTHFHDDHGRVVPRRASGYAPAGDGYRISMTTLDIVGDGGVFTTIDDLLAWDRNFHENRLGRGGPGLIRQLTTPGALNGGEPTELISFAGSGMQPRSLAESYDASTIAVALQTDIWQRNIFFIPSSGGQTTSITEFPSDSFHPDNSSWSTDGQRLVMQMPTGIYMIKLK